MRLFSFSKSLSCQIRQPSLSSFDKKNKVFEKVFSILLVLPYGYGISKENENTHSVWFLVTTEKVSARTNQLAIFAQGKIFVTIDRRDPGNSLEEAFGNFDSVTIRALLLEIYLPWEFQEFFSSRSPETSERGSS